MRSVIWIINKYDAGKFPEDVEKDGLKVVNLSSNENPYPPSDKVKEAYLKALSSINRYPHPEYADLKRAIANYLGIEEGKIAVGNGASDILNNICVALLDAFDKVVIPIPSFTLYAIFGMLRDASIEYVEFPDYKIKAEEIPEFKLLFLCSPNNPTGNVVDRKEIEKVLEKGNYVVVDEAYVEYCNESVVDLVNEFDNLVVVRSFSKFFGLAGLRIGYAIANEQIVEGLEKIRLPFCISKVANDVAIAALKSVDYYSKLRDKIIRERERLIKEINKISFLKAHSSDANFVLVKVEGEINLAKELLKRGIIVRDVTGLMGLKGEYVRITVGCKEENDILIEALNSLEESKEFKKL
ncbi:MAG TPA: histidinol-phosphate transaminase [Archaeoglobus veneficus]|nr:histidinol-phosphate transaminase [Archaeoglobus veneficus]